MSTKILHPKAKHALNAALAGIVVMLSILFARVQWVVISGTFISLALSIIGMVLSLKALKLINREKATYRGDNMAWIALILAILMFLMVMPFVIQFIGLVLKSAG